MGFRQAAKNIIKGQSTKGSCIQCNHTDRAVPGCSCLAPLCPCHRGAYGHGAWGCDYRHQWGQVGPSW
jgi:hypothetical protein